MLVALVMEVFSAVVGVGDEDASSDELSSPVRLVDGSIVWLATFVFTAFLVDLLF